jgi:DNA-binding NarL/FixJ family response regulator
VRWLEGAACWVIVYEFFSGTTVEPSVLHLNFVVYGVADGAAAIDAAARLSPNVVLMDVSLPGLNGIEAARRITATLPDVHVLMLSMHADEPYVRQSLAAGASGYLLKDMDDEDLLAAVLAVQHGQTCLNGKLGKALLEREFAPAVLSQRERQILSLIAAGHTNRDIATETGLSIHTVESHRKRIIEKLDLHSAAELVRYAIRHGILAHRASR